MVDPVTDERPLSEIGAITIAGERIEHDVLIRLSGEVAKRKKRLSKAVCGILHTPGPERR